MKFLMRDCTDFPYQTFLFQLDRGTNTRIFVIIRPGCMGHRYTYREQGNRSWWAEEGGAAEGMVDRWRIFRKFPRSPMCKYLSGVSGAVQAATYGTCRDAAMHQPRRPSASTSTSTNANARQKRARVHVSVPLQYAPGSRVNTCIKMSSLRRLPSSPFRSSQRVPADDRR